MLRRRVWRDTHVVHTGPKNNHHNHHNYHNHHNHHNHHKAVFRLSLPFCVDFRKTLAVDMLLHGERETGAARSWLKHERQTVRMVLAETFHHSSAQFPPKFKEEWVGRHEQHARPTGTEDGKDHGGHALYVEHDGGQGARALQP